MDDKSPAFQYYPKDLLSDDNVIVMTAEQFGVYWLLVSHCWLKGSLENDPARLAALAKVSERKMRSYWSAVIEACFSLGDDGRLYHGRLDQERRKQADRRAKRRAAAGRRWADRPCNADAMHEREPSNVDAKQCPASASASASPSAVSTTRSPAARSHEGFEEFYRLYPFKLAKGAAFKAYGQALKKVAPGVILAAVRAQMAHLTRENRAYKLHPATWLNQERWADETPAPLLSPESWRDECAREHHGTCHSPEWHQTLMAAPAEYVQRKVAEALERAAKVGA